MGAMVGGNAEGVGMLPEVFRASGRKKVMGVGCPVVGGKVNEEPWATGAENPPLRPPMPFCPVLTGTTPGVNESSAVKLRPLVGRSFTCLVASTVPRFELVASSCCAPASTVMTLDSEPTTSVKSIVPVWPTASRNSETFCDAKPVADAWTVYLPGVRLVKTYSPALLDRVVRTTAVSTAVSETFALGTTAPVESRTTPLSDR